MNKNIINCKHSEFVPGRTLRATVKAVHNEGVIVKMPEGRGSGVISPRCWGEGSTRAKALAALRPGDDLDVVVRLYDAPNRMLSLVLVGYEHLIPTPKAFCQASRSAHGAACPRKPEFVPIQAGTTFLWDASNLLGAVGAENVARTFWTISETMSVRGYKAMFFIEQRALTWAMHNQRTKAEAAELDAFIRRGDVVVVGDGGNGAEEADCAILQMAEALPGSVCVTRDRYGDYAHTYPGIVGTSRIRSFSVAKVGGKTMILVSGITRAIVVENVQMQAGVASSAPSAPATAPTVTPVVPQTVVPVAVQVAETPAETGKSVCCSGLFAVADECVRRGDAQGAVRIYEKVAKRDPAAYRALAEMYRAGKAVAADGKKAARYERLARKVEKSRRERSLRERRLRAEVIRSGRHVADHFAAKRRKALGLAIFRDTREMISEYRSAKRTARRVRARAA